MDSRVYPYVCPIIYPPMMARRPAAFLVICDRCQTRVETSHHYHCLQCPDFELCLECSAQGIYCHNDAHEWIKRHVEYRTITNLGSKLLPTETRIRLDDTATYPYYFEPRDSSSTPADLFKNEHRYIRKTNPREILFYTDGACLQNGQSNPQAGCAFVFRPSAYSEDGTITHIGTVAFTLEENGPTGDTYKQTSNRAELRAVIAALQFDDWSKDCNSGWRSIVIATDSEYVALGATSRAKKWEKGNWKTFDRKVRHQVDVKNQDLWQLLLLEIRGLHSKGVNISFWRIPRGLNERADKFAGAAAGGSRSVDFEVRIPTGPVSTGTKAWISTQVQH